jgi:hypothetical protein
MRTLEPARHLTHSALRSDARSVGNPMIVAAYMEIAACACLWRHASLACCLGSSQVEGEGNRAFALLPDLLAEHAFSLQLGWEILSKCSVHRCRPSASTGSHFLPACPHKVPLSTAKLSTELKGQHFGNTSCPSLHLLGEACYSGMCLRAHTGMFETLVLMSCNCRGPADSVQLVCSCSRGMADGEGLLTDKVRRSDLAAYQGQVPDPMS